MYSSNYSFLTHIQVSQEAGKVVWCLHLIKNFPVCCDTVKGLGIVNKAEVDVFLELSCFFHDQTDVGKFKSGSSAFSKFSLIIWMCDVSAIVRYFEHGWPCLSLGLD